VTDEHGLKHTEGTEPTENLTTWVFEEGSFRPAAKLTEDKNYSIITDYLGTPVQMYDEKGEKIWETELDIYGKVRTFAGRSLSDCPFRYQGQYEDIETGLYYNRFRYYSPEEGMYLSKDPIGLAGNNPTLYAYVYDSNKEIDPWGLSGGTLTIFADTHDFVGHAFIGVTENGNTTYIGQWPKNGFKYSEIPSILVSDIPGELSYNDTQYLDSPHLHSVSFDIDENQMANLKQYIQDFEAGNTPTKGYNLRNRQCASFAYGASQAAGINEMKLPWYKWATPSSLADKIDSLNCK
ncbi:MAG: RHS repeat-associated core domain-containing protein, partial [Dysgonamonadaceae bacterium]|nr:RHS repeat-associated core domain-containing protein [Dysgonamonadaceae bacterium]